MMLMMISYVRFDKNLKKTEIIMLTTCMYDRTMKYLTAQKDIYNKSTLVSIVH